MNQDWKNIVLVANTAWYLYNFRKETIKALLNDGYRVTCIAPGDEFSSKLKEIGAVVVELKQRQYGVNLLLEAVTILNLGLLFIKLKPALVFSFTTKGNIYSALLCRVLNIHLVANISGLGQKINKSGLFSKSLVLMYRYGLAKVKKVYFQNNDDLKFFNLKKIALNAQKEVTYGSGVDLKRFNVTNNEHNKIRFVLISRLVEEKGIKLFLDAAKELVNRYESITFTLVGPFISEKNYAISPALVDSYLNEKIFYLGSVDNVHEIMRSFDCFVLPSYYNEGVPKSLLEASASGLSIVTTNHRGCKETVIDGVNGFMVEPRDFKSLVEAIEKIINLTCDERKSMGVESRKLAEEKFDIEFIIDSYLRTAKGVLN